MSRSSSVSNKDKSSQGKKSKPLKQRRDDSDSFDSRSQYTPWFPPQQTPTWVSAPQYPQMAPQQFNGGGQNVYQSQMPQQFVSPNMQYNQQVAVISNGNMPSYNGMPQVSHKLPPQLEPKFNVSSSFLSQVMAVSSHIVHQSPLMVHLFRPLQLYNNNGPRIMSTSLPISSSSNNPSSHNYHPNSSNSNSVLALCLEPPLTPSPINMDNCQVPVTLRTRRVNTPFQEASIVTHSIPRFSHLPRAAVVSRFRKPCHTMAPHT